MFRQASVKAIERMLHQGPRIAIIVHKSPDGDALGSSLGWKHILAQAGLTATVVVPDAFPKFLNFLPGSDEIVIYDEDQARGKAIFDEAELIFCLDFNAPDRMGAASEAVLNAEKPIVVIDHHQSPDPFAHEYYVDDKASSTCELICRLAKGLDWRKHFDRKAAMCLYTGIITDTGSFRFSSVSPKLMRIASHLLETGIDHTEIYQHIYDNNTLNRLRLQGYALHDKLKLVVGAAAAYISISKAELDTFQFQKGDTEGLVNHALSLSGVEVAAFFSETGDTVKISLRSRGKVDVNVMARTHFNGGGHVNAAGGRSELGLQSTIAKFEEITRELLPYAWV